MHDLAAVYAGLTDNECLILSETLASVAGYPEGQFHTLESMGQWCGGTSDDDGRRALAEGGGFRLDVDGGAHICLSKLCFAPGKLLLLDVDRTECGSLEALDALVSGLFPKWGMTERMLVQSAGSRPDALKAHLFCMLSEADRTRGAGQAITRSLRGMLGVDEGVWTPERRVYAAPARYESPLLAPDRTPVVMEGAGAMDASEFTAAKPERAAHVQARELSDEERAAAADIYARLADKWVPHIAALTEGGDREVMKALGATVPWASAAGRLDELYDRMDEACDTCGYRKLEHDWNNALRLFADEDVTGAPGMPAHAAAVWAEHPAPVIGGQEPPAPPAPVDLHAIMDLRELAARLAELPDEEWIGENYHVGRNITKAELKRLVKTARLGPQREPGDRRLFFRDTPSDTAAAFMTESAPLVWVDSEPLMWDGSAWVERKPAMLASAVHALLLRSDTEAIGPDGQMRRTAFNPKAVDVAEVVTALSHMQARDMTAPQWADGQAAPDVISFRNGILNPISGSWQGPTPDLFTRCALSFDYSPAAPAPLFFFQTMRQWWPDPALYAEMSAQFQRWLGLLLIQNTSYQKIGMYLGRPRSGKGAAARLTTKLIGAGNVASCSSRALAKDSFVLNGFRGKSLVLFADMRVKSDVAEDVLEKFLNISGEDTMGINRKGLSYIYEKLSCRLLIVANLFPDFRDETGALAARLIPFQFNESFKDREDMDLDAKLESELPGILNWALEGLRLLTDEGGFRLGPVARAMVSSVYHQGAPLAEFIEDMLIVDPEGRVSRQAVYDAYKAWAVFRGNDKPLNNVYFSRHLRATVASIGDSRDAPDANGKRDTLYTGIALKA